jgi:dienelactone hydrolase
MKALLKKFFSRLKSMLASLWPSSRALRWGAFGIFLITAVFLAFTVWSVMAGVGFPVKIVTFIAFGLMAVLSGLLLDLVIAWLGKIPFWLRVALVAAFMAFFLFLAMNKTFAFLAFLFVVLFACMAGSALYYLLLDKQATRKKMAWRLAALIIGTGGLLAGGLWLAWPGPDVEYPENAALYTAFRPQMLDTDNPAEAGDYAAGYLTYGSGNHKRRPEFAGQAQLTSRTVDASKLLSGWKGMGGRMRTRYFGFDATELPLNGLVWYPQGDGPFPLVLVVHGNHFGARSSDPGYDYLGEHWASRGFITVSVDQNFLNGMHTDIFGRLGKENDARGWLLLEHLRQWRDWNADPENPFYGKVDMDRLALVGHSRGGEAVGHAALFNKLSHYPDDASQVFDFGFNIRAFIAIAPSDGQYRPAGILTPVQDINYLSIHGSHDADVRSFEGNRLFDRLGYSDDHEGFSALVYIYGANHGQFNTVWGRKDFTSPQINLINTRQLLDGSEQRTIGKFFMTAFLESSFGLEPAFRQVFLDHRTAGDWLPETIYLTQYKAPGMQVLAHFGEDLDLTTATMPGATIEARHFTDWREGRVDMKFFGLESRGVYLGWVQQEKDTLVAEYTITLEQHIPLPEMLYLLAADTGNHPTRRDQNDENEGSDPDDNNDHQTGETHLVDDNEENDEAGDEVSDPEEEFIDFTIELYDAQGQCISFPLSAFSFLQSKLEARLGKISMLNPQPTGESILQFFYFPLEPFLEQNPDFNTEALSQIRIRFDRSKSGVVVISEMGFLNQE